MTGSWALAAGEHVCWRADSEHEYNQGRAQLAERADRHAGGLLVVDGSPDGATTQGRASGATRVTLPEARKRVLEAGTRPPWVLAAMGQIAPPHTATADLVAVELELADLAAFSRTAVVCAYHGNSWRPELLSAVSAVHSRVLGMRLDMSGFRLRVTDGSYALEGSIGFESVPAFTATLHGALIRTPQLRVCCRQLELIEASAMQALVEAVLSRPGCSLLLEHAGEAVRRAWALSGYGDSGVPVQVLP
jgi:anti-anti-sigma regulatory factor